MRMKITYSFLTILIFGSAKSEYKLTYSDTLMLKGTKSYKTLDLINAKEKLDSCIMLNPKNDECKYYRAKIEYDMQSYQTASIMFKNVLALNEKDASSWHMLGLCFTHLKHYDSAEFCYRNAVNLNSKRSDFFANWANNQFLRGRLDHSEELYSTAILLDDKNPAYYTNRSEVREKMGDKVSAKDDLELALQLDPNNQAIKGKLNSSVGISTKIIYGIVFCALFIFTVLWILRRKRGGSF
ncbi:MAG: hypothetical protein JNL75_02580 [Chitinophagales bacterium]|nr:hypothetical protein [Chitinophagales bacterium]